MAEADIIRKSYETLVDQAFNAYWNNAFIGNSVGESGPTGRDEF